MTEPVLVHWTDLRGQPRVSAWRSEAGVTAPAKVLAVDDSLAADAAYRLACEGTALVWQGDFHNARQLLQALARRLDRKPRRAAASAQELPLAFHQHRQRLAQRARVLGMVLMPLEPDYQLALRRAPDVVLACEQAWGRPVSGGHGVLVSLRELQGLIGAREWRRQGVPVAALAGLDGAADARIHPHYGVFSPVRGEYLDLVARAPLPPGLQRHSVAFDIGTGTGVLAAILARRGIREVLATDQDDRALACANDNLTRLGLTSQVRVVKADLFPEGTAPLIVCNPPWVPARPSSPIEYAVYDPDSRMLRGFLAGLAAHLSEAGEGWLILSDLAEHLGLRTREAFLGWVQASGLRVLGQLQARPLHPKVSDRSDPLHAARAAETTYLWRLGRQVA